ncbi:hypothetical protein [Kitasatospora acidiphila]|uniref:DUF7739 domain-containing protein n=1 Tax=Kitasatospora acidiphila TaxID=2567942 RepID=UPI003C72FCCD
MGWTWDHDRTGYEGRGGRSYTSHSELGDELRRTAGRADWAAIAPLFNRGTGDPFTVPPTQAGRIADALTALAPLVSSTWTAPVRELAAAARAAHRAGAVWQWS